MSLLSSPPLETLRSSSTNTYISKLNLEKKIVLCSSEVIHEIVCLVIEKGSVTWTNLGISPCFPNTSWWSLRDRNRKQSDEKQCRLIQNRPLKICGIIKEKNTLAETKVKRRSLNVDRSRVCSLDHEAPTHVELATYVYITSSTAHTHRDAMC